MIKLGNFIVWDIHDKRGKSIVTQLKKYGCNAIAVTNKEALAEVLKIKFVDAVIIRADWDILAGDAGKSDRTYLTTMEKPSACMLVALCDELSAQEQDTLIRSGFDDVLHEPVHIGQLITRLSGLSRLALMKRELCNRRRTLQKFMTIADPEDTGLNFVHDKFTQNFSEPHILLIDINANEDGASHLYNQLRTYSEVHYCHDTQVAQTLLFTRDIDLTIIAAPKSSNEAIAFVAELRNSPRLYNHPVMMQIELESDCNLEKAFNAGLNDIVFGNPSIDELEARTRAMLRHELLRRQLAEECSSANEVFVRDGLTGVYSHGFGMDHLKLLMEEMNNSDRYLSVGSCAFNNLDAINRRFGHVAGDAILRQTAQIIRRCVRGEDMVARMNGSTFIITFPESNKAQANFAMSRLQSILRHTMFTVPDDLETVSVQTQQSLIEWHTGQSLQSVISGLSMPAALAA